MWRVDSSLSQRASKTVDKLLARLGREFGGRIKIIHHVMNFNVIPNGLRASQQSRAVEQRERRHWTSRSYDQIISDWASKSFSSQAWERLLGGEIHNSCSDRKGTDHSSFIKLFIRRDDPWELSTLEPDESSWPDESFHPYTSMMVLPI